MNGKHKILITAALCLGMALSAYAQHIKKMEFRNQPIVDILMALSEATGASIVPDETITGNASFFFNDSEFEDALGLFLATYKCYYEKRGAVYYVSRISSSYDRDRKLATLIADEVDLQVLVRTYSKLIGRTVLYDPLPRSLLSLHAESVPAPAVLEMLMKRFPEFRIESYADYDFLRRIPSGVQASGSVSDKPKITREGDSFSIRLDKARFQETLTELFSVGEREFSLLGRIDMQLENLYFGSRDFDGLLKLLLEQANADFVLSNGVYYIFEIQRKDVLKKYRRSSIVQLKYLTAQDVATILPADLASGNLLRVDRASNSLILTGSEEEIEPIRKFLSELDRATTGMSYQRFDIKYLKAKDVIALIPPKLMPLQASLIPESNAFVALLPEGGREALEQYIRIIDHKSEGIPVTLRYLKVEDFLKNLPPSVSKEDIVDSGVPNMVFFVGSEDKRKLFLREVELIDRPKPQIRYELLVVQYQKSGGTEWSKTVGTTSVDDGTAASFIGNLSSLLTLKFDAVSVFGYQSALSLSLEITDNRARIFADTTLTGLYGQEVKFQNTDTFRYREISYDNEAKETVYTGVTSEITSGLILAINGWVSGDGMVTMSVSATVSKQGADETSSTGNPPATSEKVVTTNVRTASGTPVVIGGLLQQTTNSSVSKLPILGDIPLLGLLFRNVKKSDETTETVIYIVPHVTFGDESAVTGEGRKLETYYQSFVKDFLP